MKYSVRPRLVHVVFQGVVIRIATLRKLATFTRRQGDPASIRWADNAEEAIRRAQHDA